MRQKRRVATLLVLAGLLALFTLSGCVLATVRTLEEDKEAKVGFTGQKYVDEIWDSQVLPTYREKAQDFTTLLALIRQDRQAAIAQFGQRSGTGDYSFMVRGEGRILTFDTSSRTGVVTVDLAPEDGTADLTVVVGPLIKISQRAAVRDAVGFIQYGQFVNQQEFADVANAMGDRIVVIVAQALGAADPEAIRTLDPANVVGKRLRFIGAFTLDNPDQILVVPVELEVIE